MIRDYHAYLHVVDFDIDVKFDLNVVDVAFALQAFDAVELAGLDVDDVETVFEDVFHRTTIIRANGRPAY